MAEIRLCDVSKRYGPTEALRGISVTVKQGELLALVGPSGCGKTTTLQILAGFLIPDGGEVWAGDRLLSTARGAVPPERRRMSLIFQSYALWPHMTVFQNVAFGLETRRLPRDEIARRVHAMLGIVGLRGYDARYPHEVSGGQQQRVALARALVVEPETLLLDEPLSNLDASLREQMRFEIRRIHRDTGITMVYVTHDQTEAMVIADRIAVMNGGAIEQVGTPQEIYELPQTHFVASFIGQTNCLAAHLIEPGVVRCGALRVRTPDTASFGPGSPVVLCIRPHAVRVHRGTPGAPDGQNRVRGRVVRQAYLGDQQDLRIALAGDLEIRAFVPSSQTYQAGEEILVELPIDACRLVRP